MSADSDDDVEWLEGSIRSWDLPWHSAATSDPEAFARGLQELGLPDREVREVIPTVDEASSVNKAIDHFNYEHRFVRFFRAPEELEELYSKRLGIIDRLSDWFSHRSFRIDKTEEKKVDLPVFVLSAPAVDGCSTSFTLAKEVTRNLSCDLKVYGTGTFGGAESNCNATCTFTAQAGEVKVVFARAELTVGTVTTLINNTPLGEGTTITAIEFPDNTAPGVKLVRDDPPLHPGEYFRTYPLAGDTPGAPERYAYDYRETDTRGFGIGVNAFGADLGLKVEVTLKESIGLEFALSGGHDYPLYSPANGHGIMWQLL